MATKRRSTVGLMVLAALCLAAGRMHAQESPGRQHAAGAGWLSPGVFVTWEAHRDAAPDGQEDATPLTLDLLVLWRGTPGWFAYDKVSAHAGAPNGRHGVTSNEKSVQLLFNRQTGTVRIGRETIELQGANVLLLDDVDNPNGALIAGTRIADPLAIGAGNRGEPAADPVKELIRQTPELFEYLRCDPAFADPNEPATVLTLGSCLALR
jgi:hypothetical protein